MITLERLKNAVADIKASEEEWILNIESNELGCVWASISGYIQNIKGNAMHNSFLHFLQLGKNLHLLVHEASFRMRHNSCIFTGSSRERISQTQTHAFQSE